MTCIKCKKRPGHLKHPKLALKYCEKCYTTIDFEKNDEVHDRHFRKLVRQTCVACFGLPKKSARAHVVCDNSQCSSAECWKCIEQITPELYKELCEDLHGTSFQCIQCHAQRRPSKRKSHSPKRPERISVLFDDEDDIPKRRKRISVLSDDEDDPKPKPRAKRILMDERSSAFSTEEKVRLSFQEIYNVPFNPFDQPDDPYEPLDFPTMYKGAYQIQGWPKDIPIERVETMKCAKDGLSVPILWNTDQAMPLDFQLMAKVWVKKDGLLQGYLVDYERYVRPDESKDRFDDSDPKSDKTERNSQWRNIVAKFHREGTKMIILDSPQAATTNTVIAIERNGKRIFSKEDLVVPNMDPDFEKYNLPSFQDRATYCHASVGEFIRDVPDDIFRKGCHFAADYCCTVEGNAHVKPFADLTLFFKRQLLPKKNGCLWLTFSLRGKKTVEATKQEVIDFMLATARHYGYKLEWLNPQFYTYQRMIYFYFVSI